MPNYKIGISNRKESRIIEFENNKLYVLENLDNMTISYDDENSFKMELIKQGLISLDEFQKQHLNIMYRNSGKVKKLPIFYSDMKKYLDDMYLRSSLMSLSQNSEFLEKLARHYSLGSDRFNPQGLNVSDIRTYLSDVRRNGENHFDSKLLSTALDDLFKKAVYKLDKSTGEVSYNYRGLRDLALFIYKFENRFEKEETEIQDNNISQDDEWEQITFFDDEQKSSNTVVFSKNEEYEEDKPFALSSEGDPLFPPNSEEEAAYNRYLEEINELAEIRQGEFLEEERGYRR